MTAYILRRSLLMFPTLIGIVTITFVATQFVPGGPIDQMKSLLRGHGNALTEAGGGAISGPGSKQRELDPKHFEQLKKIYNLDKPLWERYLRTFLWYSPKKNEPLIDSIFNYDNCCLLYTSPSPRDRTRSRMPSSA